MPSAFIDFVKCLKCEICLAAEVCSVKAIFRVDPDGQLSLSKAHVTDVEIVWENALEKPSQSKRNRENVRTDL